MSFFCFVLFFSFSCEQSSQVWLLLQTKEGFVISAFDIIHKRKIKGKNHVCNVAVGSFVLRWPAAVIIYPQKMPTYPKVLAVFKMATQRRRYMHVAILNAQMALET